MSMWKSPHKRTPPRRAIRYTREAAHQSAGRFKANGDHQPGVMFKDPQGELHVVPNKAKHKTHQTRKLNLR